MAKTVEEFLDAHPEWEDILRPLRSILLDMEELQETVKWGLPTYTCNGKNVVGLGAFKSYAGMWFFAGSLLDDTDGVLVNAQQGKTRGMRQWRFAAGDPVDAEQVRRYVAAAAENARQGKGIKPQKKTGVDIPAELADAMAADDALAKAFAGFTPGRQREFANHVGEAKREATRLSRLEKIKPMILDGVGLNDRYRNC